VEDKKNIEDVRLGRSHWKSPTLWRLMIGVQSAKK
jgi:hypothetical protein